MAQEPYTGPLVLSDDTGDVTQETYYVNGLLEKKLKIFLHKKLYMETEYVQGKKHGYSIIYDEAGNIMLRQQYKNNLLHGLSYFYVNQKKIEKALYREGVLIRKRHYGEKS